MKRITLLTAILAMLLSPTVSAATPQAEEGSIANFTLNVEVPPPEIGSIVGTYNHRMIYLRRGCCSHHKGVCGCENGRTKCCDGTFSPTCGC
nr:MAG TPA: Type 4 fimbrial biogenesis protein PilY2 [Caudoviricetes sp.]